MAERPSRSGGRGSPHHRFLPVCRSGCAGVTLALGPLLGGCAGLVPDSATPENRTLLYGEFYDAMLDGDAERADELADRLELCGRQLFVKDQGFVDALRRQKENGGDGASFGELVALFTEDACEAPENGRLPGTRADSAG